MERRFALTLLAMVLLATPFWAQETQPLFRQWAEQQDQGDYTGAMKTLLVFLKDHPGDPEAIRRMSLTTRGIENYAKKIDRLFNENRIPTVARASRLVRKRDQETREAMDNLRASYEHNWKTTPEALLHTCRGVDLQIQITLPGNESGRRMKDYLSSLCLELATESKRGVAPKPADVHRVAGFLAYQRLDLEGAIEAWGKAKALAPEDASLVDFIRRTEDTRAREKRRARSQEKTGLATRRFDLGEVKSALALYREASELDPGNVYASDQVARLSRLLDMETRRTNLGRHRGRAVHLEAEGRGPEAVREWMAVLDIDPMNTEAQDRLHTLAQNSATHRSAPSARSDSNPDHAREFYSRGLLLYAAGDLRGASKAFERCLSLDPSHDLAQRALERISRMIPQKP